MKSGFVGFLALGAGVMAACGGTTTPNALVGAANSADASVDGGSAPIDGAGSGATPIPLDAIAPEIADLFCNAFSKCYGGLLSIYDPFAGSDCVTELGRQFEDDFVAGIRDAEERGTVTYHADKAQACLDAIKAQGCNEQQARSPAECRAAIEGTVPDGGDCRISAECVGEKRHCKAESTCPGQCAPLELAGAACTKDDACEDGLKCIDGKCAATVAAGAVCKSTSYCGAGQLCAGADEKTAKTGTCAAVETLLTGALGDACDATATKLCKPPSSCVVESYDAVTKKLSWKCEAKVASGAACKLGFPEQCPLGEACDANPQVTGKFDGKCAKLPGAGEACKTTSSGSICAPPAICSAGTGKCRTKQRIGGPCADATVCYSGACSGGACVAGADCK